MASIKPLLADDNIEVRHARLKATRMVCYKCAHPIEMTPSIEIYLHRTSEHVFSTTAQLVEHYYDKHAPTILVCITCNRPLPNNQKRIMHHQWDYHKDAPIAIRCETCVNKPTFYTLLQTVTHYTDHLLVDVRAIDPAAAVLLREDEIYFLPPRTQHAPMPEIVPGAITPVQAAQSGEPEKTKCSHCNEDMVCYTALQRTSCCKRPMHFECMVMWALQDMNTRHAMERCMLCREEKCVTTHLVARYSDFKWPAVFMRPNGGGEYPPADVLQAILQEDQRDPPPMQNVTDQDIVQLLANAHRMIEANRPAPIPNPPTAAEIERQIRGLRPQLEELRRHLRRDQPTYVEARAGQPLAAVRIEPYLAHASRTVGFVEAETGGGLNMIETDDDIQILQPLAEPEVPAAARLQPLVADTHSTSPAPIAQPRATSTQTRQVFGIQRRARHHARRN